MRAKYYGVRFQIAQRLFEIGAQHAHMLALGVEIRLQCEGGRTEADDADDILRAGATAHFL